jgi:hypothetical protein
MSDSNTVFFQGAFNDNIDRSNRVHFFQSNRKIYSSSWYSSMLKNQFFTLSPNNLKERAPSNFSSLDELVLLFMNDIVMQPIVL